MVFKKEINTNTQKAENVLSSLLNKKESTTFKTTNGSSRRKCRLCNAVVYLIFGILSFSLGLLTIIYPLFNLAMDERLKMTPGFPPFNLWYDSGAAIKCSIYLFNITNAEAFLNGTDAKLKIKELGPIVYREHLIHSDPEFFDDNSTLSYTVERVPEFVPEWNEPDILNKTIIIPNIPLLFMASYLHDLTIAKIGFNLMSRRDPIIMETTIYNYLWNLTTPALNTADKYFSYFLPSNNVGTMQNVYKTFKDRVNVNIGKKHGNRDFFKINTFDYRTTAPGYKLERGDCDASLVNSTEGAIYGGFLSKNDVLFYWRKTVCKAIPLYFEKEVESNSQLGYKYVTKSNMYDRTDDPDTDCYKEFSRREYPDGLSDASHCYEGLPVTMSLPHFYDRNGYWNDKIEGYTPSKEKHTSYAIIEPTLGIPLDQCARTQSNLALPKLFGFSANVTKFSEMVLPLMWLEYHLEKLTPTIDSFLTFTVKILPVAQHFVTAFFLIVGFFSVLLAIKKIKSIRNESLEIDILETSRADSELNNLGVKSGKIDEDLENSLDDKYDEKTIL